MAHLSGGGVIEISENTEHDVPLLRLNNDIELTIRGVAGKRPVLRNYSYLQLLFESEKSAFLIDGGHLTLSDLDVRVRFRNEGTRSSDLSIFELANEETYL